MVLDKYTLVSFPLCAILTSWLDFKGLNGTIVMNKQILPIIIDVEASGFGQNSYPIEIGVVSVSDIGKG